MSNNINIHVNKDGLIETDDKLLNRIIRQAEKESGAKLSTAFPAVTFDESTPIKEDDGLDKEYILLINYYIGDKDWVIKSGRQMAYDYLKLLVKEEEIDPNTSFIISCNDAENDIIPISKPITVFRFLKVMFDTYKVFDEDTDFDINEFDPSDTDKTILQI